MPTGMAPSYYMGMPPTMTPLHPHHMMAGTTGQMIGPGEMKPTAVQQAEEPPKKRKRISKKQQQKVGIIKIKCAQSYLLLLINQSFVINSSPNFINFNF